MPAALSVAVLTFVASGCARTCTPESGQAPSSDSATTAPAASQSSSASSPGASWALPGPTPDPTATRSLRVFGGGRVRDRGASKEGLPIVVAIHGLGDAPENWVASWSDAPYRARIVLPRGPTPFGDGASWFDIPAEGPDRARSLAEGTKRAGDRVIAMLDALSTDGRSSGPVVLTGFSQGGMITFYVAATAPEKLALAVPMGGNLFPELVPKTPLVWPDGGRPLHVLALHGTEDARVPVEGARASVASLSRLGFRAELVTFPVGHTVSREMRAKADGHVRLALARVQSGALH
ncbi:MAG: dienelactone hydrolase family protein [Polyangiaceae bacterium]